MRYVHKHNLTETKRAMQIRETYNSGLALASVVGMFGAFVALVWVIA